MVAQRDTYPFAGQEGEPTLLTAAVEAARRGRGELLLLCAAAMLGVNVDINLLRAAIGIDDLSLAPALEEAVRAGLLALGGGGLPLAHVLTGEARGSRIRPPRRRPLHLAAVRAIERLRGQTPPMLLPPIAAAEQRAAAPAESSVALRYARRAAEAAIDRCAWDEAAVHQRAAIELAGADDIGERCDLLLAVGETYRLLDDRQRGRATCLEAAALARTLDAPDRLARAALAFPNTKRDRYDPAHHALLEEALAARPPPADATRAMLLGRLARVLYEARDRAYARRVGRDALAIGRRLDDPRAVAAINFNVGVPLWDVVRLDDRLALATELVRAGEAGGDAYAVWAGHVRRYRHLLERGDREAALAALAGAIRPAAAIRLPATEWVVTSDQALPVLLAGRFDEAAALADQVFAMAQRSGDAEAIEAATAIRFGVWREQGRLSEAETLLRGLPDLDRTRPRWRSLQAWLACEQGRRQEARAVLEQLTDNDCAAVPRDDAWRSTLSLLAEIAVALGDTARAGRLYALLSPLAERHVDIEGVVYLGAVPYYLGRLATALRRWQAAARHFDAALAMHAQMEARPWLAHTHHAIAAMLLARGRARDRRDACHHLAEAVTGYGELGMTAWATRAGALMPTGRNQPDGLTRRETEVLRLIAAGKTNQQIAETLVLSVRTVEIHVSSIYTKIGVCGPAARVAATSYAMRLGLTSSRSVEISEL